MATLRPAEMSPSTPPRYRRRLLPVVDAAFQWKYTALMVGLGLGTASVLGGLLYHAHQANTRLLDLGADTQLQAQVAQADRWFLYALLGSIAIMGLSLTVGGLVVTHRISGPAHLVARYCEVLARGAYPDVRPLRRRDELQTFFGAFCGAVASMRQRDTEALQHLEAAESRARAALQGPDDAALRAALQAAAEALSARRQALAKLLGSDAGAS